MTLHCNLVKLWPCPEWVAKMCVHEIKGIIELDDHGFDHMTNKYKWALERYLIWAESNPEYVLESYNFGTHKQKILEAMNNPDLNVWIE